MEPGARFCSTCGRPVGSYAGPVYGPPAPTRFVRPRQGRMIAGVCAGIALAYGWDVTVVRLVLALLVLCGGLSILIYLVAWIIMPAADPVLPPTTGAPVP